MHASVCIGLWTGAAPASFVLKLSSATLSRAPRVRRYNSLAALTRRASLHLLYWLSIGDNVLAVCVPAQSSNPETPS
jgi:hypothetical protein